VPARRSGDDFVWIGGPDEGLGLVVVIDDEAVDGGLQIDDALEDAALEAALGEDGEESLDGVEPAGGGGREVERPARMPAQPFDHLGVLVGGVVVEDGVDGLSSRDLAFDGVQEPDELLVPVALHAAADDLALQHVKGGEQGGCAMALVIVGHGSRASLLHGKAWLGSIQGLNLRLLIDAEDDGVCWRIDIEAHDVADLGGELGIVGQLEGADAVRRQAMGLPDALHRGQAHARHLGHQPTGPVCRLAGRFPKRQGHDPVGHTLRQARRARRPGLVAQQAFDARLHEPRLPSPDRRLADAGRAHDRRRAQPVGRPQYNPGAPHVLLQTVAIIDDRLQAPTIGRAQINGDASTHPADSHNATPRGIPPRTLMSRSIH
jgi:hypothetical protein